MPVSLSSAVLPELREYERTITTVVNAAVQPHVARYVANLDSKLTSAGITESCASFAATAASSPRAWRPRTRSTCSCPARRAE